MKNIAVLILLSALSACHASDTADFSVSPTQLSYAEAVEFCKEQWGELPYISYSPRYMSSVSHVPTSWFSLDHNYGFLYDRDTQAFRIVAQHQVGVEAFAVCVR